MVRNAVLSYYGLGLVVVPEIYNPHIVVKSVMEPKVIPHIHFTHFNHNFDSSFGNKFTAQE